MIFSTKAELRKAALLRRDGIEQKVREDFAARLALVGSRLVQEMPAAGAAPVASLFFAIGSEPDAMPLAMALHAAGVPLALPVDHSSGTRLVYRRWLPGDPLVLGPLGIAEPLEGAPEIDPDVLFIPLLAFDRLGHRLGYGAGNVDRTLTGLRSRRTVTAVGVAYALQEELLVPHEAHDEPVDIVVTDRDILVV